MPPNVNQKLGAFEGVISSLGATRAEDGSIDRVADPSPEVWKILAFLQAKCETENIEIIAVFEVSAAAHVQSRLPVRNSESACTARAQEQGGGPLQHSGVMKREKFCTALKDNFTRCHFPMDLLKDITAHYGIGYMDPRGNRENVAWKDFCEDVLRAHEFAQAPPGSPGSPTAGARGKGHIPGRGELPPPVLGWQPGGK